MVLALAGTQQAAAAPRLLETLSVPGLTPPAGVTTRTVLKKGASYRLDVSGTVTGTFTPPGGVTIGEREDAFYCFEELNEAAVSPGYSCTKNIRYLGALRALVGGAVDFVETALGLPGRIAYQPSHTYSLDFRAPRTGPLTFISTKSAALSPQGAFRLKLYGNSAAKKKKKKRIIGCPAARASSPVRAASSCHWEVSFQIEQKGLPRTSYPDPAIGFVESETVGIGKLFFNAKPKLGRTSTGRAAALIRHSDTYQSVINPFLFQDGVQKMTALTARYTPGGGQVKLDINATVTSVSGQVYSRDREDGTVEAGDKARIRATYDFPKHQADFLELRFGCGGCMKGAGGFLGLHSHDFVPASQNKLQISVGAPKHLAGACRCRSTVP